MNVKLVIIGASGVGKTSLRTKYTSGRFSTNYRATIGADFITKSVPHHANPSESVQLQIWDTAGQERFSSLATAFFRGADAVILVYDVTDPSSLDSLSKWWEEFKAKAPVEDGRVTSYPVAVVGNKVDLIERKDSGTWRRRHTRVGSSSSMNGDAVIGELEAREFIQKLIPIPDDERDTAVTALSESRRGSTTNGGPFSSIPNGLPRAAESATHMDSNPSPIPDTSRIRNPSVQDGDSRATSRSRYANGTMTTTAMSVYHTASSSLLDSGPPTPGRNVTNGVFWDPEIEQAIAANAEGLVGEGEVVLDSGYKSVSPAVTPSAPGASSSALSKTRPNGDQLDVPTESPGSQGRQRLSSSNSGSSIQTVTPGNVSSPAETPASHKNQDSGTQGSDATVPGEGKTKSSISKPPIGPALFFTSAKTGEGLTDVFEYIAARVTKLWEWEESQLHMLDSGGGPGTSGNGDSRIILRDLRDGSDAESRRKKKWSCC